MFSRSEFTVLASHIELLSGVAHTHCPLLWYPYTIHLTITNLYPPCVHWIETLGVVDLFITLTLSEALYSVFQMRICKHRSIMLLCGKSVYLLCGILFIYKEAVALVLQIRLIQIFTFFRKVGKFTSDYMTSLIERRYCLNDFTWSEKRLAGWLRYYWYGKQEIHMEFWFKNTHPLGNQQHVKGQHKKYFLEKYVLETWTGWV
jgi:hypothetical protein